MRRSPVAPITVLGLVAVSLLALGCAKRLAVPVGPAPTAGAKTTPSPAGPPADAPSRATAPLDPGAGTSAPPSAVGPTAPAAPAGRPDPRGFGAVRDLGDIQFDIDRYDIRPDAAKILEANARWMKANPAAPVLIEGHADERGTNEYNLALGERRAKAALNYLVSQGVPSDRFTVISYGEEWPLCRERNDACWARNRRVHFLAKPQ
jgi:peptidoglycan-associated lipoprotein